MAQRSELRFLSCTQKFLRIFGAALTTFGGIRAAASLLYKKFIRKNGLLITMEAETVCISTEEYIHLKKKEEIADDLLLQLEASLKDLEAGRIKRVR